MITELPRTTLLKLYEEFPDAPEDLRVFNYKHTTLAISFAQGELYRIKTNCPKAKWVYVPAGTGRNANNTLRTQIYIDGKSEPASRVVMACYVGRYLTKADLVSALDSDYTNMRITNLALRSHGFNANNCIAKREKHRGSSPYYNVYRDSKTGMYIVTIRHSGVRAKAGQYTDEKVAAYYSDLVTVGLYDDIIPLNFQENLEEYRAIKAKYATLEALIVAIQQNAKRLRNGLNQLTLGV